MQPGILTLNALNNHLLRFPNRRPTPITQSRLRTGRGARPRAYVNEGRSHRSPIDQPLRTVRAERDVELSLTAGDGDLAGDGYGGVWGYSRCVGRG